MVPPDCAGGVARGRPFRETWGMLRPLLAIVALVGLARVGDRLLGSGAQPSRPPLPAPSRARRGPPTPEFGDFAAFMRDHVLPLREREPERRDLGDGSGAAAHFFHDGTAWRVQGDTRLAALAKAWDWAQAHPGEDPFRRGSGKGRRQALSLRDEVEGAGPSHFYVYADV